MGWIAFGLCAYVAIVLGLAAHKGRPILLWLLFLPAVPFFVAAGLVLLVATLFGHTASAAVKQETGWKADGSRAYPYWIKRD